MTLYNHEHENEITLFAETNFRNQRRRFGIKTDDRRRHMYIIGKTGMGKTTLMENLFLADIYAGHGCCYIDPHGDTAEKLVDFIPSQRINDVVYLNPADMDFPVGFNIFETDNDEQKPLIASGLMGVFKKIWPDVWSPRMEYILMNCVLALLDFPGATLLGINRLLVDKEYRSRVIAKLRDPIVKTFWVAEFTSWSEKYATEAIAPVQNKVGQFLSSSVIRNIVAQVKSSINLRRIMDDGKILIINLSKGRIGEDNMRLLGGMIITKLQMAAQERQNMPESERRDFYLYVDEFQNFANESFANILSEARKYRLNLIVTHQYIEQLDEKVAPAIFGNVGTLIAMRVGAADADFMETEFMPTFTPEDLVNLAKTQIYLKLMVDGVSTQPFSANTLPPIGERTGSSSKVIAVSRERYAEPRSVMEAKVLQWSGMETSEGALIMSGAPSAPAPAAATGPSTPAPMAPFVAQAIKYPDIKTEEERGLNPSTHSTGSGQVPAPVEEEYLKFSPERLAAIQASRPAGGKKDKPQFPHTCSRCGKIFNLAIQLDPSRPMYCAECRPIVMEERKNKGSFVKSVMRAPPPPEQPRQERTEPTETSFAIQDQKPNAPRPPRAQPRIVRNDRPSTGPRRDDRRDDRRPPLPPATIKIVKDEPEKEESLLEELTRKKGGQIVTDKKEIEKRTSDSPSSRGNTRGSGSPSDGTSPPTPPQKPKPLTPGQRIQFD